MNALVYAEKIIWHIAIIFLNNKINVSMLIGEACLIFILHFFVIREIKLSYHSNISNKSTT